MVELTQSKLHDLFEYVPHTGDLIWNTRPRADFRTERGWKIFNTQFSGKIASTTNAFGKNRYKVVRINGVLHLQHRIVWLYVNGRWPSSLIDHKNGDGTDNRIDNLRESTFTENHANRKHQGQNASGLKGAFFHKRANRWTSRIGVNGKLLHLGMFDTPEDAHAAYVAAAEKHFGEFARAS